MPHIPDQAFGGFNGGGNGGNAYTCMIAACGPAGGGGGASAIRTIPIGAPGSWRSHLLVAAGGGGGGNAGGAGHGGAGGDAGAAGSQGQPVGGAGGLPGTSSGGAGGAASTNAAPGDAGGGTWWMLPLRWRSPLSPDDELPAREVDITPAQGDKLAAAQPCVRGDSHQFGVLTVLVCPRRQLLVAESMARLVAMGALLESTREFLYFSRRIEVEPRWLGLRTPALAAQVQVF